MADTAATASEKAGTVKVALKLRPLVDRVITATGAKKKGVKEIVEATLAEIGAALSRGEELNLPPLGKARVNRQNERNGGEVLIVKLNRPGVKTAGEKPAKEGLAEGGEEG
ncbi:DNA-binding protein [Aliigemmobacter aestuarii]|uniref:DNA-binding protein n=2 Tax=Aliigemmobacter aestuarii TaxID=1445661 RepID=A0A4S3MLS5_9RHOB|nr:DNA-binding protein [Gemmobacter aestuarii]